MSDRMHSMPRAEGFDESLGFRETFLHHFTTPEHRETLERLARMLAEYAGEAGFAWPRPADDSVSSDLRAVATDLRYVEAFLTEVIGRAPDTCELDAKETELAVFARSIAKRLGSLTAELEMALGDATA